MAYMQIRRIAGKLAGTYLAECDARTVVRVDIGGNLEDKTCELRFTRLHLTFFCLYRTGAGGYFHKTVQQLLHTEIIQAEPKNTGANSPFRYSST